MELLGPWVTSQKLRLRDSQFADPLFADGPRGGHVLGGTVCGLLACGWTGFGMEFPMFPELPGKLRLGDSQLKAVRRSAAAEVPI